MKEWAKGNKDAIARLPSPELQWNAFAKEGEGEKVKYIPNLLSLEVKGAKYIIEGTAKPPDAFQYLPAEKAVKIVYTEKGRENLMAEIPEKIKKGAFPKGSFGISIFVPEGGSAPRILLAERNAGGINIGDTHLELLGGCPSEKYGGEKGKSPLPFQSLVLQLEGKGRKDVSTIPLQGKFPEGKWHKIFMRWGDDESCPGVRMYLDGEIIFSDPADKLPCFDTDGGIPLSLGGNFWTSNMGVLLIKDVFLSDRIEKESK
jgi:hypothetical protein